MRERTLTRAELKKLAEFNCEYPWTPFQILGLIEEIEDLRERLNDSTATGRDD